MSTPPGRGAIAIIRLSGPASLPITAALIQEAPLVLTPRHATLKAIYDPESRAILDRAVLTYMQAPNSFTGEDVVEISAHGSPVIIRRLIDLALENGARVADAGEFTLRAVANGKLDLSQAEAIRDLINAQTDVAAQQAIRQLNGELSRKLQPLKQRLIEVIVRLESALEFVEDDLPRIQSAQLERSLKGIAVELEQLGSSFNAGHWLRDGIRVTIAGRPNVGKSSLFNKLLRRERAIVSDVPGTTRDTLSETINIAGIPVSFTDTAGVRVAPDAIESIGIDRAHTAIADADLVLLVIDGSSSLTQDDLELLSGSRESRYLIVVNKCDLPDFDLRFSPQPGDPEIVPVSALRGDGLDRLCEAMVKSFGVGGSRNDGFLITDARHYDLLQKSRHQIDSSIRLLADQVSEEVVLVGLHNALTLLGSITGETTTEDILSEIFATFCIGK